MKESFKNLRRKDIENLAAIAERREEPTISHDEFIKELKQDGII